MTTQGWFDVHVHSAPCVSPRGASDAQTVRAYADAGFAGCVLKGHCESTVGRAVAAGTASTVAVYGGVVLNSPVGGINPAAVATTLALGGRVVWMPTVDARAQRRLGLAHPRPCAPSEGPRSGYAVPPSEPGAEAAALRVLHLIADADAVLATGHLSAAELAWLVPTARDAGVRRVLLTHPSFAVPGLDWAATAALCDEGALAEVTAYQLLHEHGGDATQLAAFVRAVGIERCVLSSDAGHPDLPSGPEALARLIDALAGHGVDRGALVAAASERPAALVSP